MRCEHCGGSVSDGHACESTNCYIRRLTAEVTRLTARVAEVERERDVERGALRMMLSAYDKKVDDGRTLRTRLATVHRLACEAATLADYFDEGYEGPIHDVKRARLAEIREQLGEKP